MMKIQTLALAVSASIFAMSAHAVEFSGGGGGYLTGSVGIYKMDWGDIEKAYKNDVAYLNSRPSYSASTHFDDKGNTYAFGLGYRFNQYFAAEATYRSYSDVTAGASATDGVETWRGSTDVGASGLGVGVVGFLPVNKVFHLYGRLDVVSLVVDYKDYCDPNDCYFKDTDAHLKPGIGFGGQYDLNNQFAIRGEFYRIQAQVSDVVVVCDVDGSCGGLSDFKGYLNSFSLGLIVKF